MRLVPDLEVKWSTFFMSGCLIIQDFSCAIRDINLTKMIEMNQKVQFECPQEGQKQGINLAEVR